MCRARVRESRLKEKQRQEDVQEWSGPSTEEDKQLLVEQSEHEGEEWDRRECRGCWNAKARFRVGSREPLKACCCCDPPVMSWCWASWIGKYHAG